MPTWTLTLTPPVPNAKATSENSSECTSYGRVSRALLHSTSCLLIHPPLTHLSHFSVLRCQARSERVESYTGDIVGGVQRGVGCGTQTAEEEGARTGRGGKNVKRRNESERRANGKNQ